MRKTLVFDTSTLIYDPTAWKQFPNSDVIIPIAVLNELDKLKKQSGEAGRNARVCVRLLDEISDKLDISTGVQLDDDIMLSIDATYRDLTGPEYAGFGDPAYGDTQILACALANWKQHPEHDVTLVSNDINLRVKAKSRNIDAIAHSGSKYSLSDLYMGVQTIEYEEAGADLLKDGSLDPRVYGLKLNINECVSLTTSDGDVIAMGRKVAHDKVKLIRKSYPWNVSARNKEQQFAIDLIMDKNVDLVTLVGKAGSGKTLIALAASLELVISKKEYDRLIIYRPIQSVGNDIGYLPGPQPLDAKIATPNGWTTMGEITLGSKVISRDGSPVDVIGIYPKGKKSVYKITTTDGTSTECCEDHLWLTQTFEEKKRNKPGIVRTTKEIINTLYNKNGKINHYLPRNEAVQYDKKELPITPYIMGSLLGDGTISNSVCLSNIDQDVVNRFASELNFSVGYELSNNSKDINYYIKSNLYNNKPARLVKITNLLNNEFTIYNSVGIANQTIKINKSTLQNRCQKNSVINNIKYEYLHCPIRWTNVIKNSLYNLGILNLKAWDKYIPTEYKYSSIEDRIALLQGLMDTDGTIKKNGEASFCTTSIKLANDVVELVRSLGGRTSLLSRNRIGKKSKYKNKTIESKRISYEFTISLAKHINPFYMKRKAKYHNCNYMHRVAIKSIELVGQKKVQCIKINHPEHLYLTNEFIVTHNTMEEKLAPWFQAILDNFELLFGNKMGADWKRDLEMFQRKGKIEMEAITYIRGRSIPNAIILTDECQNLSKEDVKTILTRAGEGTKIILTGDIEQIDNSLLDATNNGLTNVIEKFKNSEMAGHITFTQGERSRLASKAAEIL